MILVRFQRNFDGNQSVFPIDSKRAVLTLVLKLDLKLILFRELIDFSLAEFLNGREELSEHGFVLEGLFEFFDVWLELNVDKFGEIVFERNLNDIGVFLDKLSHFDQILFYL